MENQKITKVMRLDEIKKYDRAFRSQQAISVPLLGKKKYFVTAFDCIQLDEKNWEVNVFLQAPIRVLGHDG